MSKDAASELERLRKQLEVEQGLRQAADTENERLVAQIEQYAEDLSRLYQEQHGRGRDSLAAEIEELRAKVADETARSHVLGRAYQRTKQEASQLSEQLVQYGDDLAKAYQKGRKATAALQRRHWWQKPLPLGMITSAAGLLVGGVAYGSLLTSSATNLGTVTPSVSVSASASASPRTTAIRFTSNNTSGTPGADAVSSAATAAALMAASDTPSADVAAAETALVVGSPAASSALATRAAATRAVAASTVLAAGGSAAPPGSTPDTARGTPSPGATTSALGFDLAPTVTEQAAAIATLQAQGTVGAMTATAAAALTPLGSPSASETTSPTPEELPALPTEELKRCSFEMLVPALVPGEAYMVDFDQHVTADVVVLWSYRAGGVTLEGPSGVVGGRSSDEDVVVHGLAPGAYRARLRNGASPLPETRVALFYDEQSQCLKDPFGHFEEQSAPLPGTSAQTEPASVAATATPSPQPAVPSPTLAPTATSTSAPPPPTATSGPTRTPTELPPTATATTPVRPVIDCRPLLAGPLGYIEIRPIVWLDAARTQKGIWAVHATITGPDGSSAADWTANPSGDSRRLPIGAVGVYHYELSAVGAGADLDENCSWTFEHTKYF